MKTLKNIFESKNTNKTMNNFSEILDFNAMLMIKGGGGDDPEVDDDVWPPDNDSSGTTNNTSVNGTTNSN